MAQQTSESDEVVLLLKQLLAVELWRGGLSQAEIRKRLGLGMATVTSLLKGVSRDLNTRLEDRG